MSKYVVIAFPKTRDGLSRANAFKGAILQAGAELLRTLMASPHKMSVAPRIEVRIYSNRNNSEPIEDYDQYQSVYFLNDRAIQICNGLGLSLPVIGEVENVPDYYGYL